MNTEEKEELITPPEPMDDKMASVMLAKILAIDRNLERVAESYKGMVESLKEAKRPMFDALEAFMRQRHADTQTKELRYAPGTIRLRQVPPHVELKEGVNLADHKDNPFVKAEYKLDRREILAVHLGESLYIDASAMQLPDFVTIERGGLAFSYSANNGVGGIEDVEE